MVAIVGTMMALSTQDGCGQERVPNVPPAALPDIRLERQRPEASPGTAPEVQVPTPAPSPSLPGSGGLRFQLTGVDIEGATVFPVAEIEAVFEALEGTRVTLGDVWRAARQVEKRYRDAGYFLTRVIVPAQSLPEGRVRVNVLEGFVDQVRLEGDPDAVEALIRDYMEPVTRERPLRIGTLERALLLADDIPGVTVSGLLRPSSRQVGAAELVVSAQRKPFDAALLIDNFGDNFTGEWEVSASLSSNAWTKFGERLNVVGFATEPWAEHDQKVGQASASARVGGSGLSFETVYSYGDSNPGDDLEPADFHSRTLLIGGAALYPFIRSRAFSLVGRVGFEWIDTDTDYFTDEPFSRDRLRVLSLGSEIETRDALGGADTLTAVVRQGLPILNASRRDTGEDGNGIPTSRDDGTGQATVLRAGFSRLQPLPENFSLFTDIAGQYAFAPVLANEEFQLGATRFGRGYDFDTLNGDDGIGGTAELRWTLPLHLSWLDTIQAFGFFEGGQVWSRGGLPDESLSSAGAGVRLFPIEQVLLELQFGKPLTFDSTRDDGGRDPQFLFRAVGRL